MSDKANNFTLLKNVLKLHLSVYVFFVEYIRLRTNQKHPYVKSENINSFEKHEGFLKYLIDIEYKNNYSSDSTDPYYNLVKKIKGIYGKDKSLSILSLEEAISVYVLVLRLKPEIVVETGVSDGMSSFIILSALNENKKGSLYSIDLPEVGMPKLYGKEPGWIVDEALRRRWTLIYGKTEVKLPPLLGKLKHVDIFLHDSEHSYTNMRFEFSMALRYMKEGSLLLSDDVRSNSAFQELLNIPGFCQNKMCLLSGMDSDLGALIIHNAIKNPSGI